MVNYSDYFLNIRSYGYNKWEMEENWQILRIESKKSKSQKTCFFGEGLDFLTIPQACHVRFLWWVLNSCHRTYQRERNNFFYSFQSASNFCFQQLKVFARQCPFSNMREWSVLSFEDSIFIIGQEIVPVRMLFLQNSSSA